MGIKGLFNLLEEEAPKSIKVVNIKSYTSTTIAIDASIQLYQFLVQIRYNGSQHLVNEKGEITSHLQGFLSRTIALMEKGIKPVYVFDGTPPKMKSEELARRKILKDKIEQEIKDLEAKLDNADSDEEEELKNRINELSKRTVRVSKEHMEDAKKLLRLMGVPVVEAPCEAEAQCVQLVIDGVADAVATEDMDVLTLGAPVLLKWLTDSKNDTVEIRIDKVLENLKISMDQFIDLCILCGCDYCGTIERVGPKTALKLIREHGSLETIAKIKKIDLTRMIEARNLFKSPDVHKITELTPGKIDEEEFFNFMVKEKGFSEERILASIEKIKKIRSKGVQKRIDSFFKS